MLSFPHIKINLGLHIIAKRQDGFHDIETLFYPLAVKDALEVLPSGKLEVISCGIPVPGNPEENLCIKAWRLLKKDFPELPEVTIHLLKNIPVGAGLGGGSSDGAFMIRLLDEKFELGLSRNQKLHYAQQLGSDCAFFIDNRPCFATGRGEKLEPIDLDLGSYSFLLVCPSLHVDTREAYAKVVPQPPALPLKEIIRLPVNEWKGKMINDFEETVFAKFPEIGEIKEWLYANGALYASMSGSGSSVCGIFPKNKIATIGFERGYQVFAIS